MKDAGANAVLLEYEDQFPFWGVLQPMTSPTAYSKDDLKAILDLARIHNFEVIPLVQTFGHLEFALKLDEFRHLREVDQFPMAICPSKNDRCAHTSPFVRTHRPLFDNSRLFARD